MISSPKDATDLSQFLTEKRKLKLEEVLRFRTRYITVVLEDIYQSHNASAVMRTCDVFGIQDIHIIENRYKFTHHPDIELGSSKWLTLHRYNESDHNTEQCIRNLKKAGYRLVATVPDDKYPPLDDFRVSNGKAAILFGTEKDGLSETAISHADEMIRIPMVGFTQSLNLSVTAGIFLYVLSQKLRNSGVRWQLIDEEKDVILQEWIQRK